MTRVLVLGGLGMLGHEVARVLSKDWDVAAAIRPPAAVWPSTLPGIHVIGGNDLTDQRALLGVLATARAEVIINCVGVIKQKPADDHSTWRVNVELPANLYRLCAERGLRLIHFSTDCVFSGAREPHREYGYTENHVPDPVDFYGQTKLAGEEASDAAGCLTLRTSFIGREITSHVSLVEWLLRQEGKTVNGFRHALFTGVSTTTMARLVDRLLRSHSDLAGLWHVSAAPISKYELIKLLIERGRLDVHLTIDENFFCDRRLNSSRFATATGWRAPSWPEMVDEVLSQPLHMLGHSLP